tara:strand:- start:2562 stop:5984 length:3423 start_codon:yes stop_codon:yes gene_type:complete
MGGAVIMMLARIVVLVTLLAAGIIIGQYLASSVVIEGGDIPDEVFSHDQYSMEIYNNDMGQLEKVRLEAPNGYADLWAEGVWDLSAPGESPALDANSFSMVIDGTTYDLSDPSISYEWDDNFKLYIVSWNYYIENTKIQFDFKTGSSIFATVKYDITIQNFDNKGHDYILLWDIPAMHQSEDKGDNIYFEKDGIRSSVEFKDFTKQFKEGKKKFNTKKANGKLGKVKATAWKEREKNIKLRSKTIKGQQRVDITTEISGGFHLEPLEIFAVDPSGTGMTSGTFSSSPVIRWDHNLSFLNLDEDFTGWQDSATNISITGDNLTIASAAQAEIVWTVDADFDGGTHNQTSSSSDSLVAAGDTITFNVVDDQGDSATDLVRTFLGDHAANKKVWNMCDFTASGSYTATEITVKIGSLTAGYNMEVDVYMGTTDHSSNISSPVLVADGFAWNTPWAVGDKTITLDTPYALTTGVGYTVLFAAVNSDMGGDYDELNIATDNSASLNFWHFSNTGGASWADGSEYCDMWVNGTTSGVGNWTSNTTTMTNIINSVKMEWNGSGTIVANFTADDSTWCNAINQTTYTAGCGIGSGNALKIGADLENSGQIDDITAYYITNQNSAEYITTNRSCAETCDYAKVDFSVDQLDGDYAIYVRADGGNTPWENISLKDNVRHTLVNSGDNLSIKINLGNNGTNAPTINSLRIYQPNQTTFSSTVIWIQYNNSSHTNYSDNFSITSLVLQGGESWQLYYPDITDQQTNYTVLWNFNGSKILLNNSTSATTFTSSALTTSFSENMSNQATWYIEVNWTKQAIVSTLFLNNVSGTNIEKNGSLNVVPEGTAQEAGSAFSGFAFVYYYFPNGTVISSYNLSSVNASGGWRHGDGLDVSNTTLGEGVADCGYVVEIVLNNSSNVVGSLASSFCVQAVDLSATAISIDDTTPSEGQTVSLTCTIQNQAAGGTDGTLNAGSFNTRFYYRTCDDGSGNGCGGWTSIGDTAASSLNAGSSASPSKSTSWADAGWYQIRCEADPTDQIVEDDERASSNTFTGTTYYEISAASSGTGTTSTGAAGASSSSSAVAANITAAEEGFTAGLLSVANGTATGFGDTETIIVLVGMASAGGGTIYWSRHKDGFRKARHRPKRKKGKGLI